MRIKIAPGIYVDAPLDGQLEELRKVWQANPLTRYFPQAPQLLFHEAIGRKTPIVAFFGGNQSGKTHCSVADDLIQALPRSVIPPHLLPYKRWEPPFHGWICVPQNKKLQEAIFPKLRELCPPSELVGGGFESALSRQDALLRFECGSTLGFKTYEQTVDSFSSATLHRVHWDEEPPGEHGYELRKEARARLLKHAGDEILSMTPLLGLSWVYEKVYEPFERGEKGIFCVRADIDDNEYIDNESKRQFLQGLTREEIQARKEGRFVHMRGLVYPEWDEDIHVVERPTAAHVKSQDVVIGIDPGVRTTGVVFTCFDKDNHLLIFDELYLHDEDAIPENAAKHIKTKVAAWGVDPLLYIIDPASRNREQVTGERVQSAYQRAGIPVLPGQADKEAGVFEVRRRLQHRNHRDKLDPLLHVSHECPIWRWEIGRYRMADRPDGKFEVVKEHDHVMDPTRYVAMSRPIGPGKELPEEKPYEYKPGVAPPIEQMLTPTPSIDWGL